jgi:hypothetical protein
MVDKKVIRLVVNLEIQMVESLANLKVDYLEDLKVIQMADLKVIHLVVNLEIQMVEKRVNLVQTMVALMVESLVNLKVDM